MLSFRSPGLLRMTGAIPFSARRSFDLSSDGGQFRLLVPDGKVMRFFVGPVDAPATSQNPRENLRPQPVIDALHWSRGTLDKASGTRVGVNGSRVIVVDLPAALDGSARKAEISFDLQHGAITNLTIHDTTARAISIIQYLDWQEIADRMNRSASVCFPRRIVVSQPRQDLQIEMKILSFRLNPQIPPSRFQLVPPIGIPVTRVTSAGTGKRQ
jgi:outer membrane lipoprotein-sorting protein